MSGTQPKITRHVKGQENVTYIKKKRTHIKKKKDLLQDEPNKEITRQGY